MVATTEWSKSYTKDAVVADLTTRVNNLEGVISHSGSGNTTNTTTISLSGQGGSKDVPGCPRLAKLLIVKGEEKITRDGKNYWWCPHHKRYNVYDGMYMDHDPGYGHTAWKAKIEEKNACRKNENSNTSITPQGTYDKRQLKLSKKLRASMMTYLKLYKNKVDRLMNIYNSDF